MPPQLDRSTGRHRPTFCRGASLNQGAPQSRSKLVQALSKSGYLVPADALSRQLRV